MFGQRKYTWNRQKKGWVNGVYKVLAIFLVAVAVTVACVVFFQVNTIGVEGNMRYTAQEVIDASGVQMGDRLTTLPTYQIATAILQKLPYVGSVSIQRAYPDGVTIQVTELAAVASVESDGGRWLISAQGKLLEEDDGTIQVIQINGLTALSPRAGSMLQTAEEESTTLNYVEELLEVLELRGVLDQCTALDCTETRSMMLYYGIYRVKLPKGGDYNYYIRFAQTALRTGLEEGGLKEGQSGQLDLTVSDGKGYFRPDES